MKKVITLFQRDYEGTRLVFDAIVPGAEWVLAGEGRATEKIDGTSCLMRDGKLYKRYELKKGRIAPANFEPAQEPDSFTGEVPGWLPVTDAPEDKWHRIALSNLGKPLDNGTYELIGPKVQGNKYNLASHIFRLHGDITLTEVPNPVTFEAIKVWLEKHPQYEGIVWHHPDGRMVKIKRRDFGMKW